MVVTLSCSYVQNGRWSLVPQIEEAEFDPWKTKFKIDGSVVWVTSRVAAFGCQIQQAGILPSRASVIASKRVQRVTL